MPEVENQPERITQIASRHGRVLLNHRTRSNKQPLLHYCAAELGTAAAAKGFADAAAKLAVQVADVATLRRLGTLVVAASEAVTLQIVSSALLDLLLADASSVTAEDTIELSIPVSLRRHGRELRLVYVAADANPTPRDDLVIRLLASGHAAGMDRAAQDARLLGRR